MPIEIEGLSKGGGWTSTSAMATHKAPFAGLQAIAPSPEKMTDGLKISVFAEADRHISMPEFNLLFLPRLEALNLEVVGKPKLVVEDSPIWVWRKYMPGEREDMIPVNPNDKSPTFIATLATGPLKGYEGEWNNAGTCVYRGNKPERLINCRVRVPDTEDTAALARIVEEWSVRVRRRLPTENIKSKKQEADNAISEPLDKLSGFTKAFPKYSITKTEVSLPKAKAGIVGASAAIIGIALAMLTWTQRRDK